MRDDENLRARILEYLRTRRHAAETTEGVNSVWLKRPADPQRIAEVEHVLHEMAREGLLVKHVLPGRVRVYSLPDRGDKD